MTVTCSTGTPNASAAMMANPLAAPLMSTAPVTTVSVPSGSRRHVAAAGCIEPGHTPIASPIPSPGGRRSRRPQAGWCLSLSRHSMAPIGGQGASLACRSPSVTRFAARKIDRIDAEAPGELVDERLEREHALRPRRGPVVAGAEPVRPDPQRLHVEGIPAIRAGDEPWREPLPGVLGERATVVDDPRLQRFELPGSVGTDPHVDDHALGRGAGSDVIAPVEHEPDRSAKAERRTRDEGLDHHLFRAECAPDGRRRDADTRRREAEQLRELIPGEERPLHGRRHRERTVRLEPGRRDLWLDRRLIRPGHTEPAGDDGFAASERRSHVATTLAQTMEDVAVVRLGVTDGRRDTGHRRPRQGGGNHVDDRLQRLEVDLDQCRRIRGCGFGLGDDERHGLPDEHDLGTGERLEPALRPVPRRRQVRRRQHGHDAREIERSTARRSPGSWRAHRGSGRCARGGGRAGPDRPRTGSRQAPCRGRRCAADGPRRIASTRP